MKWVVRAENLWFSYDGRVYAVRESSLEALPGEVTVVMGPTGCGKSTLLLLLAGLLKPVRGVVYYNSDPLYKLTPGIRRYIGVLFQDPDDQLFNATVYDEIAFSLRTLGLSESLVHERVARVSEVLGIKNLLDKQPYSLSVGEKKRVALASIIVYDPWVLLLDEPTANLDYNGVKLVKQVVLDAKRTGKTVVVTTHDTDFALEVADKIYLMDNGVVRENVRPDQLLSKNLISRYGLKPPSILKLVDKLGVKPAEVLEIIRDTGLEEA